MRYDHPLYIDVGADRTCYPLELGDDLVGQVTERRISGYIGPERY